MFRIALLTTCLATALVGASVGTAHASTVSPDKWAPKFCVAVDKYQSTISEQSGALTTALASVTDLSTSRDKIAAFLGKMVDAANTAAAQVKKAGAPSSPNGAKISAQFVAGLKASSKVFADARITATKLPTSDPEAFKVKGEALGHDLTDAGEKLTKTFAGIGKLDKGKKLEAAVRAAPECAFLR